MNIEIISENIYEEWFEFVPSGVEVFVCEQGNPQGFRIYVNNYEQYEKALDKFRNPNLYTKQEKQNVKINY